MNDVLEPLTFVNADENKNFEDTMSGEVAAPTEEAPVKKTEEELAAEEPEMDIENPDATPYKYNIFASEHLKKANEVANEFMTNVVEKLDMPFAFAQEIPKIIAGKLNVLKGKSKEWEAVNRADNRFHLTNIKDLNLYESIEESKKEDKDLGD